MTLEFSPSDNPHSFGHHLIIGLAGTELSDTDKRLLAKTRPLGLLLLKRNFDHALDYPRWLAKLGHLLEEARNYAEREVMLVSLDHEGGSVHRTPAPLTRFPPAIHLRDRVTEVARAMAIELRSIGVNLSWAPVADVHSNPANPVIGERAFGTSVSEVIDHAVPFARELSAAGLAWCAKHFPGHGDTATDSHLELPVLNLTMAQLMQREIPPFQALVEAGAPMVMTAHILFPQIDTHLPATFSKRILGDLLRKELGFAGLIVSDDIEMKAVSENFQREESAGRALDAGCDLFIISRFKNPDLDTPLLFSSALARSLQRGHTSEEILHQSFNRISHFVRENLKRPKIQQLDRAVFEEHEELARKIEEMASQQSSRSHS